MWYIQVAYRLKMRDPVYRRYQERCKIDPIFAIAELTKALDAGGYNVAPKELHIGCGMNDESVERCLDLVTSDTAYLILGRDRDSWWKRLWS